jgi:hypothetical protein
MFPCVNPGRCRPFRLPAQTPVNPVAIRMLADASRSKLGERGGRIANAARSTFRRRCGAGRRRAGRWARAQHGARATEAGHELTDRTSLSCETRCRSACLRRGCGAGADRPRSAGADRPWSPGCLSAHQHHWIKVDALGLGAAQADSLDGRAVPGRGRHRRRHGDDEAVSAPANDARPARELRGWRRGSRTPGTPVPPELSPR